jgi:hypothetical protein
MRHVPAKIEPDKKAIKQFIMNGNKIDGCEIVTDKVLKLKK